MATQQQQDDDDRLLFIDVGANLLDERYTQGKYRGSFRHEPDFDAVVRRAAQAGLTHIILTAGTLEESRHALQVAREWNTKQSDIRFHSTVGVHPTRCKQVFVDEVATARKEQQQQSSADDILQELLNLCKDGMTDGTVCAVGEIGLDYDRLEFCPKEIQLEFFEKQLKEVAVKTQLPLFLHNRSVGTDLYDILIKHKQNEKQHCFRGVVHSFDDTTELALKFINDLQFYIGLNGCSLRTVENLETAAQLPLQSIVLETDCPYCDIRKTHAGFKFIKTEWEAKAEKKFEPGYCVKSRTEPCHIVQVAEVISGCKKLPLKEVANVCHDNTLTLYGWNKNNNNDNNE